MRYLLITATMLATPATAQIRDPAGSNAGWPAPRPALPGVARDLHQVDRSIRDARDADKVSRKEARELRREGRRIAALEERYARDGLSESERAAKALKSGLRAVAFAPRPVPLHRWRARKSCPFLPKPARRDSRSLRQVHGNMRR